MKFCEQFKSRAGFSIMEALVVISIMAVLTGFALTYNRSSETQLALFKDQAVVTSELYRAKAFSIEKYNSHTPNTGETACGFGIHFNPASSTFIFFQDATSTCKVNRTYQGDAEYREEEKMEKFSLDPRLEFQIYDGIGVPVTKIFDITFIPPDPVVSSTISFPIEIGIRGKVRTTLSAGIEISAGGQITTK